MPLFIKESFLYKLIYIFIINPYNNSFLKKIIDKCSVYVINSAMYTSLNRYFNKEPYFIHSMYYKICNKFIRFLDKIADFINKILTNLFIPKNKKTIEKFKNLKNINKFTICSIFTIITINILIGYIVGGLIAGYFSINPFFIIILLICISLLNIRYRHFSLYSKLGLLIGLLGALFGIKIIAILLIGAISFALVLLDYEIIIYALALYPFIDYALRLFMPSVAGMWDEILFLAMIFVWGYKYLVYRKENSFKKTPMNIPIIIFLTISTVLFIINSPDHSIGFEGLRAIVQYILWYFVVLQLLKDEKSAKRICLVFISVVSIMAIHGVIQYIIGVEMPKNWVDSKEVGVRTRVFSILTSPNILGSLMTLATPICLAFVSISKSAKSKAIFLFFSLMMIGTLMFTFSRGAWIGFAFAIAMYVFLKDKRLFIPVIILGIFAIFLVPGIADRISYMLSPEYIASSLRGGRLVRWITGLKILADAPLVGIGLGHFGGAVAMNHELFYLVGLDPTKTFYMDNYYLKTGVEMGLIGLVSFFSVMYLIVINGIRTINITKNVASKELEIGIVSGLFGVIVHNFVENVFEVPMMSSCFWLLVAVLMHLWYINYHKNKTLYNKS